MNKLKLPLVMASIALSASAFGKSNGGKINPIHAVQMNIQNHEQMFGDRLRHKKMNADIKNLRAKQPAIGNLRKPQAKTIEATILRKRVATRKRQIQNCRKRGGFLVQGTCQALGV